MADGIERYLILILERPVASEPTNLGELVSRDLFTTRRTSPTPRVGRPQRQAQPFHFNVQVAAHRTTDVQVDVSLQYAIFALALRKQLNC